LFFSFAALLYLVCGINLLYWWYQLIFYSWLPNTTVILTMFLPFVLMVFYSKLPQLLFLLYIAGMLLYAVSLLLYAVFDRASIN
jgi:hypothetical protein